MTFVLVIFLAENFFKIKVAAGRGCDLQYV